MTIEHNTLDTSEQEPDDQPLDVNEVKEELVEKLEGIHRFIYYIFGFLFQGVIKKINDTAKEYCKQIQAYKAWIGNPDIFIKEEDIKFLKEICKNLQNEIKEKENGLAETGRSDSQTSINYLKARLGEKEAELKDMKAKFSQRVSQLENAKKEAAYQEEKRQFFGNIIIVEIWAVTLFCLVIISLIIAIALNAIGESQEWPIISYGIANFCVCFVILATGFFISRYREVPHKHVWIVEAFGRYVATWQSGPHFVGPFMKRQEEVYLGDFMNEVNVQEGNEGANNKIEFLDSSAGIKATYYWRIFSPYDAVYANEDVVVAVQEKMEAGLRAYYGRRTIDEAIETQASMDLREIIIQDATEAKVFKNWGVEITSLAVTDFFLPSGVEEARQTKLEAEKRREVAEVELKTAEVKKDTARINGKADGEKIKAMADVLGITPTEAMNLDLSWRKYTAMGTSEMLFMSEGGSGGSAVEQGAQAGAAAGAASRAVSRPVTQQSDEEDQTS